MTTKNYVAEGYDFDTQETLTDGGNEFVLLPEGNYTFTVIELKKGHFNGSAKTPECNTYMLIMAVDNPEGGTITIKDDIILHPNFDWKIAAVHRCLGLREHGEGPVKFRFGEMVGKKGTVKLIVDEWTNNKGGTSKNNKVDRYLDPVESQVVEIETPAPKKSKWGKK